jgi:hypothetical protein
MKFLFRQWFIVIPRAAWHCVKAVWRGRRALIEGRRIHRRVRKQDEALQRQHAEALECIRSPERFDL